MTISSNIRTAVAAALALATAGCDPLGAGGPSGPETRLTFDLPAPLYVGSTYSRQVAFAPFAGLEPLTYTARLSEVLLDSLEMDANSVKTVKWTLRPRPDTLRIWVRHAKGVDSIMRLVVPTFATGFAPVETSTMREYVRHQFGGTFPNNTFSTSRVVLKPLGPYQGGFRFEIKTTTVPDSVGHRLVYAVDTVRVRRHGNRVELWQDTGWSVPGFTFPYFVQDTLTTLNENAGTLNGVFGTVGVSEYPLGQGTYQPGVGLIRLRQTYYISMRGSDGWSLDLL